jgi:hypothetical protein
MAWAGTYAVDPDNHWLELEHSERGHPAQCGSGGNP